MKGAVAGITFGIALVAAPAFADRSSTSIEQGYDLGETPHPRSLGLAGQQQVFGGSTSALFLNPANLPLYKVYHLEGIAALGPEARRQTLAARSSTRRAASRAASAEPTTRWIPMGSIGRGPISACRSRMHSASA